MPKTIVESQRTQSVLAETDVLVAGGGVSGVAAAVAAARAGARTLLVERQGFLGGVAAAGLMTSATNFCITASGRPLVRGIAQKVLDRLVASGGVTPDWRTPALPQLPFDQETFRVVLVEMLHDAGVEMLLETWVAGVLREGETLTGVLVETQGGRQALLARAFVDATGNADLVAAAGAPYRNQPPDSGSLLFQMRDVDLDQTAAYFEAHPDQWPHYCDQVTSLEDFLANWRKRDTFHLPHGGGRQMRLVQDAIARGDYIRERGLCRDLDVLGMYAYRPSGAVLINSCNFRIDHLDPATHSQAEGEARRLIPVIGAFLREHFPGFADARVSESAAATGVRYTRWIEAGFDLTASHVAEGTEFQDAIGVVVAHARHPRGGTVHLDRGVELPYRILVPRGVDNLIVASGKSVSTDPRGAVRGQIPCYVLGQAAGAAAAVAAQNGARFSDVKRQEVQRELLAQGAYLGSPQRLVELGLDEA
jgi:hypothetical protein